VTLQTGEYPDGAARIRSRVAPNFLDVHFTISCDHDANAA
jgi:hypothetical protein